MEILYISSVVSDRLFEQLYKQSKTSGNVGQKYHGMFVKGLAANLGHPLTVLSQPPTSARFLRFDDENSTNNIKFKYIPIIPIPIVKQIVSFFYNFFYTLYWSIKNLGQEKVVICSLMRIYQIIPSFYISRIFRSKIITVVCDIPRLTIFQATNRKPSLKSRLLIYLSEKFDSKFDGYVLLTEAMNSIVNPKSKPYIVIEGFSDIEMEKYSNHLSNKNSHNIILYAGGLNINYGIQMLVEAFKRINKPNSELWLYGNGDFSNQLINEKDDRIKYFGQKLNKEVVEAEIRAKVLINPRPTSGEFTHYSFPSKTLEYMSTGTFTITTKLAGIPSDYFNYCGVINEESIEGIGNALSFYLDMDQNTLHAKGLEAKEYVLKYKNNITQTKKVLHFLSEL